MFGDLTSMSLLLVLAAYLAGSIPFGLLLSKVAGEKELRGKGSQNIGATNVARVVGKKWGALTLLLDMLKGFAIVCVASYYVESEILYVMAVAVVLGHVFPIWLKFKGGKGVATTLGVLLGVAWPLGLFSIVVWLGVFALTRVSSLSAILSMMSTPTFALYLADDRGYGLVFLAFILCVLVVVRHSTNIKRLLNGEEGKII